MEPDYQRLDPEERRNKMLAALSALFGFVSLIAGLIPACGLVVGICGIIFGVYGRKSENRRLASFGIILSILGLIIALVYAVLLAIKQQSA